MPVLSNTRAAKRATSIQRAIEREIRLLMRARLSKPPAIRRDLCNQVVALRWAAALVSKN